MSFEDFETYPNARGARRPKGGCIGKLLPMLIIAMVAMWLMRRMAPPEDRSQPQRTPQGAVQQGSDFQIDPVNPRQPANPRADSGDWSIEQVETTNSNRSQASGRSGATSTTEGDWTIEEVESNSSGTPGEQTDVNDPKSTTKGDWEIEEVESGKP